MEVLGGDLRFEKRGLGMSELILAFSFVMTGVLSPSTGLKECKGFESCSDSSVVVVRWKLDVCGWSSSLLCFLKRCWLNACWLSFFLEGYLEEGSFGEPLRGLYLLFALSNGSSFSRVSLAKVELNLVDCMSFVFCDEVMVGVWKLFLACTYLVWLSVLSYSSLSFLASLSALEALAAVLSPPPVPGDLCLALLTLLSV